MRMERRAHKGAGILLLFCLLAGLLSGAAGVRGVRQGEPFRRGGRGCVIVRESGSGTRDSFLSLFEIGEETSEAAVVNRSGTMLAAVAGNPYAIGYGSLLETAAGVKAVSIDGVKPGRVQIQSGEYPYVRPFYMAVLPENEEALFFLDFCLSEEGRQVTEEAGYLPAEDKGTRERELSVQDMGTREMELSAEDMGTRERELPAQDMAAQRGGQEEVFHAEHKLVAAGSSSVSPVTAALAEVFENKYPGWEIELQQCDTSTGMRLLEQGTADVALLSRMLSEEEQEITVWAAVARDGLVVLVNEKNPVESLTTDEIRAWFRGDKKVWD